MRLSVCLTTWQARADLLEQFDLDIINADENFDGNILHPIFDALVDLHTSATCSFQIPGQIAALMFTDHMNG